jgi:hypothetical protein
MSPTVILLFVASLLAGSLCAVGACRWPGLIGPAVLFVLGGGWPLWMDWLRYRSWRRHRDSEFVPGTQHLALLGAVGYFLWSGAAIIWLMLGVPRG